MKQKIYNVRTDKSNLLIYKDGKALKKKIAEEKKLQEKSISITENGDSTITPDEGYDGLETVSVNTNVQPELENITITKNGEYESDKDGYDKVTVNVSSKLSFADIGYYNSDDMQTALAYSKTKLEAWDPTSTSASQLYYNDETLKYAPKIDTSKVTDMYRMFEDCNYLVYVPLIDTSKATNADRMFYRCVMLQQIPEFDLSSATSLKSMFYNCSSLTKSPRFLNTTNVTTVQSMFSACEKLQSVQLFDTSNVTTMEYMFYNCYLLNTIPLFNTQNVTNMRDMFSFTYYLKSIPPFDTSNVNDITNMFYLSGIVNIPQLNLASVYAITNTFYYCSDLMTIGGFVDLGKSFNGNKILDLSISPLTSNSVTNIANTVYDMNNNTTYGTATIKLKATVYSALTEEQKAKFAAKKWTVMSA